MGIDICKLSHSYDEIKKEKKYALKSVSLSICDGELVAIIGQTGSGKTTLIQYLNGLYRPEKGCGEVWVDGIDTRRKDLRNLRENVGMVFQHPENQLFAESVYEDIAFGLRKKKMSEAEVDQRISEVIRLVEIDDALLAKSPFELSFGQKRRVAIAGVVAMKPSILVLDEPMAGLDARARRRLIAVLKNLNREEGYTIIIVSHSMENVAELAKRVIVMNEGEVVMDDEPRKVFAQSDYLRSISLDVPEITQIMLKYENVGVCLSIDEAIESIVCKKSNEKNIVLDGEVER